MRNLSCFVIVSILIAVTTVALAATFLLLILLVLMQRPRQEGLNPVFGHSLTHHCWGPQTSGVLQKLTAYSGALLLLLCLALSSLKAAQAREWSVSAAKVIQSTGSVP
jgi:preprotein translocase subunit SecG